MIILRDYKVKYCAVVVSICLLTSCKLTEQASSQEDPLLNTPEVTATKVPKELSTKQRFIRAIEHLEFGREKDAMEQLKSYLEKVPNSKNAKGLLAQINTDADTYFPAENFSVKLESGESLSTLSRKYLGSALKFYALAKYNNISNPSRVNVGQQINIPLTDKAKAVLLAEASPTTEVSDDKNGTEVAILRQADTEIQDANVSDATSQEIADEIEALPLEEVQGVSEIVSAESVLSEIISAIDNVDYSTASQKVDELKVFGPLTSESRNLAIIALVGYGKELASSDSVVAAGKYAEAGQMSLMNGQTMSALENFKIAANLDPENAIAMDNLDVLQKDMADKFHREASSAFRRQDLDVAIMNWNKVLEIDPDHSSARVYLEQAKELKVRLQNISN